MDTEALGGSTAAAWARRAPAVKSGWFVSESALHGVRHTQRVHIHAQRLAEALRWDEADTRLALCAALWHDIGRTNDDVDPEHGAKSAARVLQETLTDELTPEEASVVLFVVFCHSRSDGFAEHAARAGLGTQPRETGPPEARADHVAAQPPTGPPCPADPRRALRILWLLKDADALDRVRLPLRESADPAQLRHPETVKLLPFADELYRLIYP